MSPAAWGVVTHQASPVLAFSATTAGAFFETYSSGKVSGKGTNFGGLVGFTDTAGTVTSTSYWNAQTSGLTVSAGGTGVATTALMDTQGTYAGWDFELTWGINPNSTPYLVGFQIPH